MNASMNAGMNLIQGSPVETALDSLRAGRVVVLLDADGTGEASLVFGAACATAEVVGFVVRYSSGYLCVALDDHDADRLQLPALRRVGDADSNRMARAFSVSVDAIGGVSTGISAADRARTISMLADFGTTAAELTRPGHVVPARVRPGGVLEVPGQFEAARDLAELAGLRPAAGLATLSAADSSARMASLDEAVVFAAEHELVVLDVSDVVAWQERMQLRLTRVSAARMALPAGTFTALGYRVEDSNGARDHVAFVAGPKVSGLGDVPVRVHLECQLGNVFAPGQCGCGAALTRDLEDVARHGTGVVIYLRSASPQFTCARSAQAPITDAVEHAVVDAVLGDLGVRRSADGVSELVQVVA